MLYVLAKVAALAATSVVAIPYITALMCNLAYGWPQVGSKYRRAFSPKKVYALNFSVLQSMLISLRYATLYLQWNAWYKNASVLDVKKDIVYGCNRQKLDLYLPRNQHAGDTTPHPVVVFAYGGAWGSGNKKMYGLLCSSIANRLNVIVCCPNHSTYPQGYVDDMVQDMVECLSWLYQNVEQYNGDRNRILMLGHSSGAHLCAMTMLELYHDLIRSTVELPPLSPSSLHFRERHFADRQLSNLSTASTKSLGNSDIMQSSAESFQLVNGDNGSSVRLTGPESGTLTSSQFEVLETQKSETELLEGSLLESEIQELTKSEISGIKYQEGSSGGCPPSDGVAIYLSPQNEGAALGKPSAGVAEEDSGNDSMITVRLGQGEEQKLLREQPTMLELRKSLRAVIGIAGVYDIGEHFKHEMSRGVEDISSMCRAMRGPENFHRFSPTCIVSKIPSPISFPKVVLLHGTEDYVVPLSSSSRFLGELERIESDAVIHIIPSCDHYEICLDLMKPNMPFHNTVMNMIADTANSVFVP